MNVVQTDIVVPCPQVNQEIPEAKAATDQQSGASGKETFGGILVRLLGDLPDGVQGLQERDQQDLQKAGKEPQGIVAGAVPLESLWGGLMLPRQGLQGLQGGLLNHEEGTRETAPLSRMSDQEEQAFKQKIAALLQEKGIKAESREAILSRIKNILVTPAEVPTGPGAATEAAPAITSAKGEPVHREDIQRLLMDLRKEIGQIIRSDRAPEASGEGTPLRPEAFGEKLTERILGPLNMGGGLGKEGRREGESGDSPGGKATDPKGIFSPDRTVAGGVKGETLMGRASESSFLSPRTLIEQVVQTVQELPGGVGRVRMTLNPPTLGTLDMDVVVRSNHVDVILIAENPQVRDTLQSNLGNLRTALEGQGLLLGNLDVQMQGGGGDLKRDNPFLLAESGVGHEDRARIAEDVPDLLAQAIERSRRLHEGDVSVFA